MALEVVEGGGIAKDEVNVEFEEHGDDDQEGGLDGNAESADDEVYSNGFLAGDDVGDFGDVEDDLGGEGVDEGEDNVEEEEHEELAVGKAHAVGNPGTVVVHVQHASLARRAVMASWLERSTSRA